MNNAIKVITDAPLTKQTQARFADQVVTAILDGEVNPLDVDIYLKAFEESIALIRKDERVKRAVQDEAEKYPEKTFIIHGVEVSKAYRTNYDFDACGDSVIDELKKEEAALKKRIRERQALLRAIPEGQTIASPETGELVYPPQTKGQAFLQIEFK